MKLEELGKEPKEKTRVLSMQNFTKTWHERGIVIFLVARRKSRENMISP
jgi:hypothetical protein